MQYVVASLYHERDVRHPMHQFLVETDGFEASRLLGSTVTDGVHTAVFHVDGWPPEPYETRLSAVPTVREYDLSVQSDDTFAVYVREELDAFDQDLVAAFGREGIVAQYPIVYRRDGSAELTLVGPGDPLQAALADVPSSISVDVSTVGEYDVRRADGSPDLTDRQYEALAAAVEHGYYEVPRDGSVEAVAAELDCAPSTAAEHLRRAERTVMRAFL